jgi:hypothetical protein
MANIGIYFYTLIHYRLSPIYKKVIKIDYESQGEKGRVVEGKKKM